MKNSIKLFRIYYISIALIFMSATLYAQSTWKVDPAHTKVTFSTVHNTIADVGGLFNTFESSVTANNADFSDAVFDLTIDVESIDTEIKMRDDHLRSADFFEVEKFSKMTFKSTSVEKTQDQNRYKLKGDLTMRGITKPITMDLWFRGTITNPQNGNEISGFQITGVLNRLDYGIGPKFPETLISNEVMIKADGEYIKQK